MQEDIKSIPMAQNIFKNANQMFPLLNTSSIVVDMEASVVVKESSVACKQKMFTSHEFFEPEPV